MSELRTKQAIAAAFDTLRGQLEMHDKDLNNRLTQAFGEVEQRFQAFAALVDQLRERVEKLEQGVLPSG